MKATFVILLFALLFHQSHSLPCRTCSKNSTGPKTDALIIGEYIDWKYYALQSYGAIISNINASIYTHILMSVSTVSSGTCIITDNWLSLQSSFSSTTLGSDTNDPYKGLLNQVRKLKLVYPHLKVILGMVDSSSSTEISAASANSTSRIQLATSCVNMMLKYGLDGINIDWGKPNLDGTKLVDVNNYVLLAAAFRSAITSSSKPTATLSISAVFDPWTMSQHFNLSSMASYLDWINVRPMWYWGGSNSVVGHFSNLSPAGSSSPHSRSAIQDLQTVLNLPVSSCKIVFAIPTFGFGWQLPSVPSFPSFPSFYNVGTSTAIFAGSENGRYIDIDILPMLKAGSGWTTVWDSTAQAMVYYSASQRVLITYESTQSVNAKLQYAVDNNLAGIFVDDMGCDMNWNLIATAAFKKFQSARSCLKTTTRKPTTRKLSASSSGSSIKQSFSSSGSSQSNSASYNSVSSKPTYLSVSPKSTYPSVSSKWTYPPMPAIISSIYSSSSSSSSSSDSLNATQIDVPFWAQLISLPLERSLAKYKPDRIQTELQFFITDAANALSMYPNQIVNCSWVVDGSSTSKLSFTLLPGSGSASQVIANRFSNQMQNPNCWLRQGALLQFAPVPPVAISTIPVHVRRCANNAVISASSQCSDVSATSTQSEPFLLQTTSIIVFASSLTLALSLVFGVCIWQRRRHLHGVKGPNQELIVGPIAVSAPVQNPVSFFGRGMPAPMLDVTSYNSADEGWQQ